MAFSKIKNIEINKMNSFSNSLSVGSMFTALSENKTDSGLFGGYFDMIERDDKYLFMVMNTSSAKAVITVKAGNSIQATTDIVSGEINPSGYLVFMIDSGHFKWVTPNKKDGVGYIDKEQTIAHGVTDITEKGKVFITANKSGVGVTVFKMPV